MTDAIAASPPMPPQSAQSVDKSTVEKRESAGADEKSAGEFSAALEAATDPGPREAASPDPAAAIAVPPPAIAAATGLDEATEVATTGGVPLPFARQAGVATLRPEARAALQAATGPAESGPAAVESTGDEATAAESGRAARDERPGVAARAEPLAAGGAAKSFDALLERLGATGQGGGNQAVSETAGPTQTTQATLTDGVAEAARRDRPAVLKLDTQLPVHAPRFAEGMSQQVVVLAQHGIQQAQMSLSPPEFGPVDVRITIANDEASVQLAAPTAVAREAIQEALPRLKEMMEQSGVRLNDSGVFAQLPQRDQSGLARERGEGWQPPHGAQAAADEAALPAPIVMRHVGFVDAYA